MGQFRAVPLTHPLIHPLTSHGFLFPTTPAILCHHSDRGHHSKDTVIYLQTSSDSAAASDQQQCLTVLNTSTPEASQPTKHPGLLAPAGLGGGGGIVSLVNCTPLTADRRFRWTFGGGMAYDSLPFNRESASQTVRPTIPHHFP